MELLYRDDAVAVCLKPFGVLSEDGGGESMPALLREACGGYIGAVHRLDRPAGGVMVYSRDPALTGRLTQAFHETGEKIYLAVVAGDPGDAGAYEDLLYHDPRSNKTFVVQRPRRGVREARLRFEKVQTVQQGTNTLSLVRVMLDTGRTHQIRTQFASRQMPIVGDRRYGSRVPSDTLALWSAQISFLHPKENRRMTFRHAPPDVFPFSCFSEYCCRHTAEAE
ncbi:MAG: RluA family pseudouridine synthase [Clostridia bacterium]|nr:RluA family pseudouridine synthase [Clostridia bacterium]